MPTDTRFSQIKTERAQELLTIPVEAFSALKITSINPPKYEMPNSPEKLFERLAEIATIFNPDKSFNGESLYAEEYALCLIEENKLAAALQLFNVIAEDEKNLLFLNSPAANGVYISEETANMHRKLGFEGLYQYAKLLIDKNPNRAKKLLLEIAEKVPTTCYPIRLQDIRVSSLILLKDLGVHNINRIPIQIELQAAKAHQY